MHIRTKGRFAVTAMIDVALQEASGPVKLASISRRQHISLSYLEQLFSKLRQHGLVTSARGPGGGYSICRRIDDINLADIISAVEDTLPRAKQQSASPELEITQGVWDAIDAKVLNFARSVTLESLVLEQSAKGVEIEQVIKVKCGVFKRPLHLPLRPKIPNSVFALGRIG